MGVMGIIVAILKIIGIILLALIVVLLLIISVVLFVPIVYQVQGQKYEAVAGDVFVSWIFGLFGVQVTYQDGQASIQVLLAGKNLEDLFRKNRRKKKKKKKAKKRKKTIPKESSESKKTEAEVSEEKEPKEKVVVEEEMSEAKVSETEVREATAPMYQRIPMREVHKAVGDLSNEAESSNAKDIHWKKDPATQTVKEDVQRAVEDVKETLEEKVRIDKSYFIKMSWEEKKAIIDAVFKLVKRLIEGVMPNKLYLKGIVGTGDPQTTGYILAGGGIFKGLVYKEIDIEGNFEKACLEGEIRVQGKLHLSRFVKAAICFIIQKPIRKIIIIYWKGRGE